jgi:heat shock protein HslJ
VRLVVVGPVMCLLVLGVVSGCGGADGGGADVSSLEGKPWVLTSGVSLPQGDTVATPSASFKSGTVGGSTGCNRYTAGYTVDGDSLHIGQVATTRMACVPPADAIEREYLAALGKVTGWALEDGTLVLVGDDGGELLRFEAASPVGSWEATGVLSGDAFVSLVAGTKITARFGADGALGGSAGCNTYTSSYTTDGGGIEITPPAATRKTCASPAGVMEQETAYLAVLPVAVSYRVDGRSLELLSADGTFVATFTRGAP